MTYATLMVNLALGSSNKWLLDHVARLADKFRAGVVGIAAARPIQVVCDGYSMPAPLFEEDRTRIALQIQEAEVEFRTAMSGLKRRIEWKSRTTLFSLAETLVRDARSADLIITEKVDASIDVTRRPSNCDLVMKAGRPVLLIPAKASAGEFNHVLIAWKDTREARRAIVDSLPMLAQAGRITVVEIAHSQALVEARNFMSEVVAWLASHGITAESTVMPQRTADASQLNVIARQFGADLLVAGASGYSRQRTWVMGDMSSELLANDLSVLLSH